MAGFWGSSWPIPFVVPPCTQPANLRNRHKVPRVSGSIGGVERQLFRSVVQANLKGGISSPIALGGYRPWGCQVAGKGPSNGAKRLEMPTPPRPPKAPAAVSFGVLSPQRQERDQ